MQDLLGECLEFVFESGDFGGKVLFLLGFACREMLLQSLGGLALGLGLRICFALSGEALFGVLINELFFVCFPALLAFLPERFLLA